MKERPILFSAPMVRAILAGTKTQTRRVVKQQITPLADGSNWHQFDHRGSNYCMNLRNGTVSQWSPLLQFCPYGQPGDRLWVRETFCPIYPQDPHYNGGRPIEYDYAATYKHGHRLGDLIGEKKKWSPSIHMPRSASRITLEITRVRVERLQNISGADAIAEGLSQTEGGAWLPGLCDYPEWAYRELWKQINGAGSWDANPWVWVVEFKRMKGYAA